jgi:hypothetical protein
VHDFFVILCSKPNLSVGRLLDCFLVSPFLPFIRLRWMLATMMHKHSLSAPIVPASAPTSPACSRINRTERLFTGPVTPQRLVRPQKSSYRSPVTPASTYSTPYTPLSLRSLSSASSSTITTPGSTSSFKRYPISPSAENDATAHLVDKSLADIAENWRSRANENGIKVSNADDSNYGDDEGAHIHTLDAVCDSRSYMILHYYEILVDDIVLIRCSVEYRSPFSMRI